MSIKTIEKEFHQKVSAKIRVTAEGTERFRIFTPFRFEDGDHLAIVLKREGDRWVFSDEAHTYMHLTYDLDEKDLHRGTRQKIITNTLSVYGVKDRNGELLLNVPAEQYGDALFSYIQALLRISDVSLLPRERVRSTFLDDFRTLLSGAAPAESRAFDWNDQRRDPKGISR